MILGAVVFLSFLPCLLYLAYGAVRGRFTLPRGLSVVILSLVAVAFAVVGQLALESLSPGLSGWSSYLVDSFVSTALTEEGARFALLVVACGAGSSRRGLSRREAASRALLAGLAFASFENISYGIRYPDHLALRFLTAVPVHAGASLLCWRTLDAKRPWGLLSAFSLHGLYALGLFSARPWFSVGALLLIVRLSVSAWGRVSTPDGESRLYAAPSDRLDGLDGREGRP